MLRSYPIEGTNLNEFDMQSPEMAKQLLKFSILQEIDGNNLAKHFYTSNIPTLIK